MLSQFESLMIFLFENIKMGHVIFSRSERLRILIVVSSEWRIGTPKRPFAYQRLDCALQACKLASYASA
jgi:hypothetical protein